MQSSLGISSSLRDSDGNSNVKDRSSKERETKGDQANELSKIDTSKIDNIDLVEAFEFFVKRQLQIYNI